VIAASAVKEQFLSIIVVTVLFSLAVRKIPADHRRILIDLAYAVSETVLIVVGWLMKIMPVAVFALSYGVAQKSGITLAGALGYFVLVKSGLMIGFTLFLYLIPTFVSRLSVLQFAGAILPAQLVALSTRSSLATLPSLL